MNSYIQPEMKTKRRMHQGWKLHKFGELTEFKNGLNYKSIEKGASIRFLGVGDFQQRSILSGMSAFSTISLDRVLSEKELLRDGDLVFGRCLIVYPGNERVSFSGFTIRARLLSNTVTSTFISLLMQSGLLRKSLKREGAGTNISNLNQGILQRLDIPVPSKNEQAAIADLLSTWDEVIDKTEQLIQTKEKKFNGYTQKTISHRCDSWLHVKPNEIFGTITEKKFPDEELLSVTQDRGVIPRSMLEGRVMSPDGTTSNYKRIKCGDFAISLRSFQGGIEYSNYQGIISPAYTVLRPKMEINSDFYRLFFKSYIFIEKYLNLAVIGIRDGKQISIPDFMNIKIPVPLLEEQKIIAEALIVAQQEIALLKQLAEKYKTQKRGLMQKLLTGEWRVRLKKGALA
jgi:type I restriction enzyme S subunit